MSADKQTWTPERLFARYFAPLYPPELRSDLSRARLSDANPAENPHIFKQLDTIAETFAALAPKALDDDTLELDFSDASVHRLAAGLTQERRDAWLAPVMRAGEVPPLVQLVTHGAVYLGACVVRQHGGVWQVRNPLWESLVQLESAAGVAQLAFFQWWLKALSDDEIGEPTLSDRYRMHVEVPLAKPDELPVIAEPGRKLPRLKKVRYDSLHKYLRAHLPELRDVGEHFPSPERLDELGFQWLDFMLVGEGRMLLMHGPGDTGVHLFWLDISGFRASAFFPADAFPAHIVKAEGPKLQIHVPILGKATTHEMLWWGP